MEKVYGKPSCLADQPTRFCPGCMHGLVAKLICECVDKLDLRDRIFAVMPVGCGAMSKNVMNFDTVTAAHGRAPAVATGYSRSRPEKIVFTYQGDGDLAAIGFSEIMHAANRGEHFMTIFINNSTYGMTGGQMAPTTLVNQKTTTTPNGRNAKTDGYPIKMCELMNQLEAPVYITRIALDRAENIIKAKKAIEYGLKLQMQGKGYAFIELLSNCPTNWGLTPEKCREWITTTTSKTFPVGEFRNKEGGK